MQPQKTYLSFTLSEGDNLQYCQHHLLRLWRNPARGSLPLGWTIAPGLRQILPGIAIYYARTATANDEFIAGPSGAAYVLPSCMPRQHLPAFFQLTAELMQSMHLNLLEILDTGSWFGMGLLNLTLQKLFGENLAPHGLRGILSGAGRVRPYWHNHGGILVYQNLGLALNPQRTLHLIKQAAARGTRFINIYIFAWNVTPADLQALVNQLGDTFVVVTPGRLLELIEQETSSRSSV